MKKARMIVNIAMAVVLLCLMAYTLVFLMILSVLASMVSGIMLSNKLYTFLPRISGTSIARSVHMVWNDLGGTGRAFIYEEVHDLIL